MFHNDISKWIDFQIICVSIYSNSNPYITMVCKHTVNAILGDLLYLNQ